MHLHVLIGRIGCCTRGISHASPEHASCSSVEAIASPETAHAEGNPFKRSVHVMDGLHRHLVANNNALLWVGVNVSNRKAIVD